MKQASTAELTEYRKSIGIGFLEGVGLGIPLSFGLLKYTDSKTAFKNAGTFPRTLAVAAPIIFLGITMMERHSRMFEEAERRAHMHINKEIAETTTADSSILKTVSDNRYKIIVAGWATTLGGCFWAINRDPYLTKSQKIVQARVYAQGATVIMLVGSVLLTARSSSKEDKAAEAARAHALNRNSWERDLAYVREEK